MKVYLAATADCKLYKRHFKKDVYILESFYYFKDWQKQIITPHNFILDSGAFTFMNNAKGKGLDWDNYVVRYAEFIRKNRIRLFFELDIDVLVGLQEVERLRRKLERLTGKQCIPVWHKSRGKAYFLKMVKEYKYVAIGGIVTKEIRRSKYPHLKWFIDTAHAHGCKIHGLGFTDTAALHKYNFDSVDSTSWKSGRRFGTVYYFENGIIKGYNRKHKRMIDYRVVDIHNLKEWIKFQKYAEERL